MNLRLSPGLRRFGWGWWLGPQALAGRPEALLVGALCGLALALIMLVELLSPPEVGLWAFAFIPVLASAWLLSRQVALVVVLGAVGLRLAGTVLRHAAPATSAADVLALGAVGAMVLFLSNLASRETQFTNFQLAQRLRQAATAHEHRPPRDPTAARAATVQLRLARVLAWRQGDLRSAGRIGRYALQLLQKPRDSRRALPAANEVAWIEGLAGDLAGQERTAKETLRRAELASDIPAQIGALYALSCAAMQRGNFQGAQAALRRGIALSPAGGMRSDADSQHALLAACQALGGRLLEAQSLLDPAASRASLKPLARDAGVLIHWLGGQFAAAVGSLDPRVRPSGRVQPAHDWAIVFAAISAAELGRSAEALEYLTDVRAVYQRRDYALNNYLLGWAAGFVDWQQGRLPQAAKEMEAAASGLLAMEARPAAAFVLVDLAELASQCQNPELAGHAAELLRGIASQLNEDVYRALGWMASGWSMLASGRLTAAPEAAQRAADVLDAGHYLAYLGRTQDLLGQALQGTHRAQAISALNRAAAIHRETGAAWREMLAAKALRQLRQSARQPAEFGSQALTRREREVARLAAQGQTAREIAQQLVVAYRTVETHLANAYTKLGVHSRLDLVSRLDELGPPLAAHPDPDPRG